MSTDARMQPLGGDPGVRHPARTRAGRHQATPRRGGPRPVARRRLRRDPIALPPRKPQISPPVLIAAMPSDRRWLPPPPLRPDRPRRPTLPRTRHHRQSTHGHRAPSRVAPSRVALSRAQAPRVAPSRVAPSRGAPSRGAPSRVAPSRVALSRAQAPRVAPSRVALSRAQAPRVGALRVGAAGVGALRVGALRAQAPQSAGRSSQNPPTTAGLERPVTREWTSLRGLRPAAPERQARSAAPKWTEEVTNPDRAPVRLWSLRPPAAPPKAPFPEGGRSVVSWQPLGRSKLCRVRGPRRAPQ